MNNNNKFSNEDINTLIAMLSKKMGVDSEKLKSDIKNGNINNPKANEILNDKEKLNKLLNSPEVKLLLKGLKK